jgi:hypothetical protein
MLRAHSRSVLVRLWHPPAPFVLRVFFPYPVQPPMNRPFFSSSALSNANARVARCSLLSSAGWDGRGLGVWEGRRLRLAFGVMCRERGRIRTSLRVRLLRLRRIGFGRRRVLLGITGLRRRIGGLDGSQLLRAMALGRRVQMVRVLMVRVHGGSVSGPVVLRPLPRHLQLLMTIPLFI